LENRGGGLLVVGERAQQFAAERGGLAQSAAGEKGGELSAPGLAAGRVELGRPAERLGRLLGQSQSVQHMAAVEMVFGAIGYERHGPVDRRERRLGSVADHLDPGQYAQRRGVRCRVGGRFDDSGGLVDPLAAHQQLAGMDRRGRVLRSRYGGAQGQIDGILVLAGGK
jgi:hypothetical protein